MSTRRLPPDRSAEPSAADAVRTPGILRHCRADLHGSRPSDPDRAAGRVAPRPGRLAAVVRALVLAAALGLTDTAGAAPAPEGPVAALDALGAQHATADARSRVDLEARMARLLLDPDDLVSALSQAQTPAARAFAAWALGRVGTTGAAEALLAALDEPDDTVRTAVYASLGRGAGEGATERLVTAAVRDPCASCRAAAAAAAEALAGSDVRWHEVDADLAVLADAAADPFARTGAARRLSGTADRRALAPLLTAAASADPTLAQAAVAALGRLGDWRATEPLLALLGPARGRMRYELLGALATLGDPLAVGPVSSALRDPDAATRQLAVRALALLGPTDLFARMEPLASDPSEDVRTEVLWAATNVVRDTDSPHRTSVLARLAEDDSPFIRAEALRLCAEVRPPPAAVVEALPRLLRHADPLVRLAAADAIVAAGLADAAPQVRAAAGRARTDAERERLLAVAAQLDGLRSGGLHR